jgi:hypothetical protein
MPRYSDRSASKTAGQSKLTRLTLADRLVNDQSTVRYLEGLRCGSKALCAAILKSGKLHGPMTPEVQIEAVKYAHDVTHAVPVLKRPRTGPRTVIWGDVK